MSVPAQSSIAPGRQVSSERRQHERLRLRTPMHIVRIAGEAVSCEAVCTDVSFGGLGFNTGDELRVGERIDFEFINADHAALTFQARVLYRSGQHYGAYFLK